MDFRRLDRNDLVEALKFYNKRPPRGKYSLNRLADDVKTIWDQSLTTQNPTYPEPVVDLYIATQFIANGGEISNLYLQSQIENLDPIGKQGFANVFGLDENDPNFSKRLIRILDLLGAIDYQAKESYDFYPGFIMFSTEKNPIKGVIVKVNPTNAKLMDLTGQIHNIKYDKLHQVPPLDPDFPQLQNLQLETRLKEDLFLHLSQGVKVKYFKDGKSTHGTLIKQNDNNMTLELETKSGKANVFYMDLDLDP